MYIEYNDLDLLELFLSEPLSLTGNVGDGEISYSKEKDGFKITLQIFAYQMKCNIYITYRGRDVFDATIKNVTSIVRSDIALSLKIEEDVVAILYLGKNISVSIDQI